MALILLMTERHPCLNNTYIPLYSFLSSMHFLFRSLRIQMEILLMY